MEENKVNRVNQVNSSKVKHIVNVKQVKQNKPTGDSDIKKLIESIQNLSILLEKSTKIQEKLFVMEQKKLLLENKQKWQKE